MKLFPTRALIVVGAALAFGIGGGIAVAAIPDADGTFTACINKTSGAVRIIDTAVASAKCSSNELRRTWNGQGVPGVSGFEVVQTREDQTFDSGPLAGFSNGVTCPEGKVTVGGGGQAVLVLPGGGVESAVAVGSYPISERFWTMEFERNGGDPIPAGTEAHIFISAHCITAN